MKIKDLHTSMTIYFDSMTVREELIQFADADGEIISEESPETEDDRASFVIQYEDTLTLDSLELDRLQRFLSAMRTGNPEMELSSSNGNLQVIISADANVYREEY